MSPRGWADESGPATGVVVEAYRVHPVQNLYLAGSGVCLSGDARRPTPGVAARVSGPTDYVTKG